VKKGGYTTTYTVSRGTEIGLALRFAIEHYYKEISDIKINTLLNGAKY
jgi:hypothetical protein